MRFILARKYFDVLLHITLSVCVCAAAGQFNGPAKSRQELGTDRRPKAQFSRRHLLIMTFQRADFITREMQSTSVCAILKR